MANLVRIDLKREQSVRIDKDKNLVFDDTISNIAQVYISCDSMNAWIGSVDNYEDLLELAGPENLEETLTETLSYDEYEIITAALFCSNYKYLIENEWFTVQRDREGEEE